MTEQYFHNIILRLMYIREMQLRHINVSTCHWMIAPLSDINEEIGVHKMNDLDRVKPLVLKMCIHIAGYCH